jgi:curli biogenesis system outer membrane secretion channel CsgG
MKFVSRIVVTVLAALIALAVGPGAGWAQQKWRIAVVEFENKTPDHWWGNRLGRAASDMLTTHLVKTGKFDVYEREKLQAILNEQGLGKSGAVTPQSAAKVGQLLGIQYIVTGAVSEFGRSQKGFGFGGFGGMKSQTARAVVDARLVNTSTGQIILADNASSSEDFTNVTVLGFGGGTEWDETMATKTMRGAIETITAKIVDQVGKGGGTAGALEALVARVASDGKIWINAGSGAGVKVGDVFDVLRKGEEIKDPATGQVLDVEMTQVGQIEITEVRDRLAIAKIRTGRGFQANDVVKRP